MPVLHLAPRLVGSVAAAGFVAVSRPPCRGLTWDIPLRDVPDRRTTCQAVCIRVRVRDSDALRGPSRVRAPGWNLEQPGCKPCEPGQPTCRPAPDAARSQPPAWSASARNLLAVAVLWGHVRHRQPDGLGHDPERPVLLQVSSSQHVVWTSRSNRCSAKGATVRARSTCAKRSGWYVSARGSPRASIGLWPTLTSAGLR